MGSAIGVIACNVVGIAGAFSTATATDTVWHTTLTKPSFQPPGWIFGPAWTLLCTLMGVALYRLFERRSQQGARMALMRFGAQLFLNGI